MSINEKDTRKTVTLIVDKGKLFERLMSDARDARREQSNQGAYEVMGAARLARQTGLITTQEQRDIVSTLGINKVR